MGAYLTVLLGLVAIVCGMWGIVSTWPLFWTAITAILPPLCVLGGLLAILVGLGEIRESLTSKAQTPSTAKPTAQKS